MKKGWTSGLLVGLLLASLAVVSAPAAAACGDPLDVQVDGDACASLLAVSATGDAQGATTCRGLVSCVAVSGTGNAANNVGDNECGVSNKGVVGCVAVSGAGSATNSAGGNSCGFGGYAIPILFRPFTGLWVLYPSAGCVAVSGAGEASNHYRDGSCGVNGNEVGCIAVSGAGDARNQRESPVGYAECGRAGLNYGVTVGCIAVSGLGDAENHAGAYSCGYGTAKFGVSLGCVAVSGAGDARNEADGANGGSGSCGQNYYEMLLALGCVAVSGAGSASNTGTSYNPGWTAPFAGPCSTDTSQPHAGVGVGCVAVSIAGTASNVEDGQPCDADLGSYSPGGQSVRCLAVSPTSVAAPVASPGLPAEQQVYSQMRAGAPDVLYPEPLPASEPSLVAGSWWDNLVQTLHGWFQAILGGWA